MDENQIITPLGAEAAGLHEMFTAMRDGGFTEYQACVIIGTVLGTMGKGGTSDGA